jgi:hypothetical protein
MIIGKLDVYNKPVTIGSIIDIHQTVNGCTLFIVFAEDDIRYHYDKNRHYEYDIEDLFDTQFEIVGDYRDILDNKINSIIE